MSSPQRWTGRRGRRTPGRGVVLLAIAVALPPLACAGTPPAPPVTDGARLAPCPSSPNCVSSDAPDAAHRVAPFVLAIPAPDAWKATEAAVAGLPRTRIVFETDDSLHAECRSAVFRFVDDLELALRRDEGLIAVRSASRLGYGDFGVNRARVESLRSRLVQMGVVEPE